MLLHANKKAIQQQPLRFTKRSRPPALAIPKIKHKAADSPTFRPQPLRSHIYDSLQVRCQGMKLNSRDLKSPQKIRKRISGGISRTVTLIKPLLSTAAMPISSSFQLETRHIFPSIRRFSDNPEEIKTQKHKITISSTALLPNNLAKKQILKEKIAYYTILQRYAGLHPCDEQISIPKDEGVLESWGICEVSCLKYYVSDLHIGYSFKNLMGQFGKFQQITARFFLRQLVTIMSRLNGRGFSHNRLNLDSIVHDGQGCLLVNFFKASNERLNEKDRQNYFYYVSPQMLTSQTTHKSDKNDVWAIGCIALQFLSSKSLKTSKFHPYNKLTMNESHFKSSIFMQRLKESIKDNWLQGFREDFSNDALNFIQNCLQINEEKRPSFNQLIQHPFLETLQ